MTTATTETPAPAAGAAVSHRQIPIVCPGHTRPLAEVQFLQLPPNDDEEGGGGGGGGGVAAGVNVEGSNENGNEGNSEQRPPAPPSCLLVSACHDRSPMMRDGRTGDWIGTFEGHKGAVWSCTLDRSGYLAATAGGDFSVKVWDAVTGKELRDLPHGHIVKTVAFSPDSKRLATGGHEGLLRVYDLLDVMVESAGGGGGETKTDDGPATVSMDAVGGGGEGGDKKKATTHVTKVAWIDDAYVLTSCSDGTVRLWNVPLSGGAPRATRVYSVGDDEVRDMELKTLNDGRSVLTVAAGDEVVFFDMTNATATTGDGDVSSSPPTPLRRHRVSPVHYREEGGASLHPSGDRFVTGGSDLWVRVLDFQTGRELECLKGHHGPVRCVRYAPDGKTYATGSEDGTIRLWRT